MQRTPYFADLRRASGAHPDFICVGAQKAGTTWLSVNLRTHRSVFMPPGKEIAYFSSIYLPGWAKDDAAHRIKQAEEVRAYWASLDKDKLERSVSLKKRYESTMIALDILCKSDLSDNDYALLFSGREADQILGEISPQYAVLPREGIRHVLSINPNLKIIVLLRHPVSRAMSHLVMLCGKEPTASRMKEIALSDWWNGVAWYSDYATWLLRWKGMLPPGQVHIDYTAAIRDDPMGVLRRLCDFLGIPFDEAYFPKAHERVFEGGKPEGNTDEVRAIVTEKLAPLIEDLRRRMPDTAEALDRQG